MVLAYINMNPPRKWDYYAKMAVLWFAVLEGIMFHGNMLNSPADMCEAP